MTQLSGAFTVEVPTERLARQVAAAVVELFDTTGLIPALAAAVVRELRETGTEVYDRGDQAPDPGAGRRRGARFGGVTESGTEYEQEPDR